MMEIIAQIILCMVAASLLGFIIGWIFSSLVRNEKHQKQVLSVRERFDEQKEEINLLETKIDTKDREILTIKKQYGVMQKEMSSQQMESEDDNILRSKISDIETENLVLLEQIKEQQICEDDLEELKYEKKVLMDKIEELKEFEASYKDNIHRIAELESRQNRDEIKLLKTEDTPKKDKKKSEKKIKKSNDINNAIYNDKQIISDKNLTSMGIKEDKISKIIKNLFPNTKD